MFETRELIVPGYKHQTKGRYNMTLRVLYGLIESHQQIVLEDAYSEEIIYAGIVEEFPFYLSEWIVDEFYARGNKLVFKIFN